MKNGGTNMMRQVPVAIFSHYLDSIASVIALISLKM